MSERMSVEPGLVPEHEHWRGCVITALRFSDGKTVRAGAQMPLPENGYCTAINAYSEFGNTTATVWFEVKIKWAENWRVNGAYVEHVEYTHTPLSRPG